MIALNECASVCGCVECCWDASGQGSERTKARNYNNTGSGIVHEHKEKTSKGGNTNRTSDTNNQTSCGVVVYIYLFIDFILFLGLVVWFLLRRTLRTTNMAPPFGLSARARHNAGCLVLVCTLPVSVARLGKALGRSLANPEPPVVWSPVDWSFCLYSWGANWPIL